MTAWLEVACRLVVRLSRSLVPAGSLALWSETWESDYWRWLIEAGAHESADGRAALAAHARGAFAGAIQALRTDAALTARRTHLTGHPAFPIAVLAVALVGLTLWTGAFPETRRMVRPPRLPVAENLVLISQARPYLGARRGFTSNDTAMFARESDTLVGVARQQWYTARVGVGQGEAQPASNVGPGFFEVLGVAPALGKLPTGENEFAVSYAYWREALGGEKGSLGRTFRIDGRPHRLTGVLPEDFAFLAPVAIYTAREKDPPPPTDPRLRRWYGLKGVVGRLKPGVTAASAEFELFTLLDRRNMGRHTFEVHASPYGEFLSRTMRIYGTGLLACLLLAVLATGAAFYRDVRSGYAKAGAARYWALLLAKVAGSLVLTFLFVMEVTGVNRQGLMGGVWFGRDLFAMWLLVCGAVVLGVWAWRDQRNRCHVCLHKLRDPIRIGIPGQVLLETTGLELMCPKGHGILYSPESVLGSEMSDHWLGLQEPELDLEEPAGPTR